MDNFIFSIVRNKLEYKSMVRNSVTSADAQQLEHIQRKFLALCCTRFCSPDCNGHSYANTCHFLHLRTLRDGRPKLDEILLIIYFSLF